MQNLRQVLTGLLFALISILLVLGGLSLSLAEGGLASSQIQVQNMTPEATAIPQPTPLPGMPSLTPLPTRTPTRTQTIAPPPACSVPRDWTVYIVQAEDSLSSLAQQFGVSEEMIAKSNCMPITALVPDTALWLPPLPTPTGTATATSTPIPPPSRPTSPPANTQISCGHPPKGWVAYVVQPGDTLFKLSQAVGVSQSQLQFYNCIIDPNNIHAGSILYLPFIPSTRTRTATRVVPSNTPVPSATYPPSLTPTTRWTNTPTSVPTDTPTYIPTNTPTLIPTATSTPILTDTPTPIPTDTPTPPPTQTPTLPPTNTPTLPPTQTDTPIPTDTPTFVPTSTSTLAAR